MVIFGPLPPHSALRSLCKPPATRINGAINALPVSGRMPVALYKSMLFALSSPQSHLTSVILAYPSHHVNLFGSTQKCSQKRRICNGVSSQMRFRDFETNSKTVFLRTGV
jgi:hypothetical protein